MNTFFKFFVVTVLVGLGVHAIADEHCPPELIARDWIVDLPNLPSNCQLSLTAVSGEEAIGMFGCPADGGGFRPNTVSVTAVSYYRPANSGQCTISSNIRVREYRVPGSVPVEGLAGQIRYSPTNGTQSYPDLVQACDSVRNNYFTLFGNDIWLPTQTAQIETDANPNDTYAGKYSCIYSVERRSQSITGIPDGTIYTEYGAADAACWRLDDETQSIESAECATEPGMVWKPAPNGYMVNVQAPLDEEELATATLTEDGLVTEDLTPIVSDYDGNAIPDQDVETEGSATWYLRP